MRARSVLVCAIVAAAILGGVVPFGGGAAGTTQSSFDIAISNSVDIPTRTATIEGDNFTVSAVARRFPGDSLQVEVTAPSADTQYDVNLYNSQTQIEQSDSMTGSGTATFDTGSLPAGSYYAAVYHDGNTVTIHPVVIAAYEVALTFPSDAEPGEQVSATVDVTRRTRDRPPNFVQVVVGDADHDRRVNATAESTGTYTTEFTVDLPEGEYVAYGVARGENDTDAGDKEVVGHSAGQTFEVTGPTPTPTEAGDGGGGDGGDGGGATATPPATPTATPGPTPPPTPTPPSTPTATPTSTSPPAVTSTPPPTPTDTVITPRSPTSPPPTPTPTTGGVSGFGLLVAVVALGVLAGLSRWP